MTTFTSEDREQAQKYVEEAPYHPGYEDAVIVKGTYNEEDYSLSKEIDSLFEMKKRYIQTSTNIIEFIKNGQKWDR